MLAMAEESKAISKRADQSQSKNNKRKPLSSRALEGRWMLERALFALAERA